MGFFCHSLIVVGISIDIIQVRGWRVDVVYEEKNAPEIKS